MSVKIKVYNDRPYDIGVITLNNQHINIKKGSFALLSEDDIAYIESICAPGNRLFGTGKLRVDKKDEEILDNVGITKEEENVQLSPDEIADVLKGSVTKLRKWLETITDPAVLYEVYQIAKEADLSASKMKAVKEVLPDSLAFGEE